LLDEFDGLGNLVFGWHGGGCEDDEFGWEVGEDFEEGFGGGGVWGFAEGGWLVDEEDDVLFVELSNVDFFFTVF
jgi:hypothetical protein